MALDSLIFVLRVMAIFVGIALAYRGWHIHEKFLQAMGFIIGAVFGIAVAIGYQVDAGVGAIIVLFMGGLGAGIALALERVFITTAGFVAGVLVGVVYLASGSGSLGNPVVVIFGAIGAILAWYYHKGMIIAYTAYIGAYLLNIGITKRPSSVLVPLVFITGIVVQWHLISLDEEGIPSLQRIADEFVEGGPPIPIKVLIVLILAINTIAILQIALAPEQARTYSTLNTDIQSAVIGATITTGLLVPVSYGLWLQDERAWYAGLVVFALITLSTMIVGSAGFVLSLGMLYFLWKYRRHFTEETMGTFQDIQSTDSTEDNGHET